MERLPIVMKRDDLLNVPDYPLPEGFAVRPFALGDEGLWADLKVAVDEFPHRDQALARFMSEFVPELDAFSKRSLFLVNEAGQVIGSATAWYGDLLGELMGRLHWVSIRPDYQGRGLSKPLLSEVLKLMAQYHSQVYLTSQTTSFEAVNLYLQYGFKPVLQYDTCDRAWALLEEKGVRL